VQHQGLTDTVKSTAVAGICEARVQRRS